MDKRTSSDMELPLSPYSRQGKSLINFQIKKGRETDEEKTKHAAANMGENGGQR